MTGFGRSETEVKDGRLIVEARSENHRFFDARVQVPETVAFLESDILKQLKKVILRGKVKVAVTYETERELSRAIDPRAARAALSSLKKLQNSLNLKGEITLEHILSLGDLIKAPPERHRPGGREAAVIKKAFVSAIEKLDESRSREGKRLKKDLLLRSGKCKRTVKEIKNERGKYEKEIKRKIAEKTKSLLKDKNMDETGIYQEMAAVAEKSDTTEEIVRMNSHLSRFSEFLSKTGLSVGRELDFLTQEMNRESGTISAKSKSPAISHLAIDLRSEIEKMREQIQNVE